MARIPKAMIKATPTRNWVMLDDTNVLEVYRKACQQRLYRSSFRHDQHTDKGDSCGHRQVRVDGLPGEDVSLGQRHSKNG